MRITRLRLGKLLTVASLTVALSYIARADNNWSEWHDHSGDCQIQGSETMEAAIVLSPTTNAPDGAMGTARLESENEDGNTTATLEIKTTGLIPGDYVLSANRQSDGSSVILGQITIASCGGDDDGEDNSTNDQQDFNISVGGSVQMGSASCSTNQDGGHDDGEEGNCGATSESELQLPSDLNPADIAQLMVSDMGGNAILAGDLVNPTNGTTATFSACVQVTVSDGSTNSSGVAQIKSVAHKGKWKHHFTLVTSGVAASSTFDVHVNGEVISTTRSNGKGKALVKKLPENLLGVRSVTLVDAQGHAAAKAKF